MTSAYPGPLRREPLPVELHNTLYAVRGRTVDGLADASGLRSWLAALGDRLPVDAGALDGGRLEDFVSLRTAVREALHAASEHRAMSHEALAELNRASAANPRSPQLVPDAGGNVGEIRHHAPTPTDAVLGVIAAEAIELVSEPGELRACGAPGCVLMFVKDHARREWCSATCGNRARQARHYARRRQRRAS
jgi:predicted RNA-binding Zn ribbon-like protein